MDEVMKNLRTGGSSYLYQPAPGETTSGGSSVSPNSGSTQTRSVVRPQNPFQRRSSSKQLSMPAAALAGAAATGAAPAASSGALTSGFQMPQPVASAPTLPQAPAASTIPNPVGRGSLDELISQAAGGTSIVRPDQATLGGPAENNAYEAAAESAFSAPFDPGSGQFVGDQIRKEVLSPAQVQQLANQRSESTVRAFQDAERLASEAGSSGGYVDANRINALRARGAIEGAGARSGALRDATLEAAQLNAQQEALAAENERQNYNTDLTARLGLGRLGLDTASTAGGLGLEKRGLDQARDLARYSGDITQRGQDLDTSVAEAGLNADLLKSALSGELTGRGQDIDQNLNLGRLGLDTRQQELDDILNRGNYNLAARGQDISQNLNLGRLGLDASEGAADRQNKLDLLDRQLENASLDRETRSQLERERMDLEREMQGLTLGQRESEFGRTLGENQRQFDTGLDFEGEQGRLGRNFAREGLDYTRQENTLNRLEGLMDPYQFEQMFRRALRNEMPQFSGGGSFTSGLGGWNF